MSKIVEVMARAHFERDGNSWDDPAMTEEDRAAFLLDMQASIAALDAAGFVVAPKEPTTAAREVALATATKFNPGRSEDHIKAVAFDAVSIYRAMLAASQVTS